MTEEDIMNLIQKDPWMMDVLRIAEKQNLPNWLIGAGFVRNKVWDYLHGYKKEGVETHDIDFVYFDPDGNDEEADDKLSAKLKMETGIPWEIINRNLCSCLEKSSTLFINRRCDCTLSRNCYEYWDKIRK